MKGWFARRRGRYDAAVLGCLLLGDVYAYDMWRRIGGSGGQIYLALARLEDRGVAVSDWDDSGRPRRRYWLSALWLNELRLTAAEKWTPPRVVRAQWEAP